MIDVAVIGGGPAAIAVSIHLRKRGLTVVQLDAADHRQSCHAAAQTIGLSAIELLRNLGIDTSHLADLARFPDEVQVEWSQAGTGDTHLFAMMPRSLIVDQAILRGALIAIADRTGVTRWRVSPGSIELRNRNGCWEIDAGQHAACARIVIDATGRAASVIRRHGAKLIVFDSLTAWTMIVSRTQKNTTICVASERDGWRFECACAGMLHITFVGDRESEVDQEAGLPESLMVLCRQRGFDAAAKVLQKTSAAVAYLDRAVTPGMLAIGDAAMALDPLSAGGLGRALHSAETAAGAVANALDGDLRNLLSYEKDRRRAISEHVSQRSRFYGSSRFTSEPFWKRRSASIQNDSRS